MGFPSRGTGKHSKHCFKHSIKNFPKHIIVKKAKDDVYAKEFYYRL